MVGYCCGYAAVSWQRINSHYELCRRTDDHMHASCSLIGEEWDIKRKAGTEEVGGQTVSQIMIDVLYSVRGNSQWPRLKNRWPFCPTDDTKTLSEPESEHTYIHYVCISIPHASRTHILYLHWKSGRFNVIVDIICHASGMSCVVLLHTCCLWGFDIQIIVRERYHWFLSSPALEAEGTLCTLHYIQ